MVNLENRTVRESLVLAEGVMLTATKPQWAEIALSDLDAVLCDHVHCERKAAQSALSLIRNYPQRSDLVTAVSRLAHEETSHVIQMTQVVTRRGGPLQYDLGDDYAVGLRRCIRKREPDRLLDNLLVFALIEARSAERLALLSQVIPDVELADLYASLARAERRHRDMFLVLAQATVPPDAYAKRLAELVRIETEIMTELPLRPRIH